MSYRPVSTMTAILRGARRRCPKCGVGKAFAGYLVPVDLCSFCGESLGHIRADDFPPYLTILIVGHIMVPLILFCENAGVSTGVELAIWLPLTLMLTLILLPFVKGGILGLMWSLAASSEENLSNS
jgi:uncharacterized protein (DUF983 family)